MRAFIISDNSTTAVKLRQSLSRLGYESAIRDVVSLDQGPQLLAGLERPPDLVLLVLPESRERSLEVFRQVQRASGAKVMAVGATSDAQAVLDAVREGAQDYLDENGDLHLQLTAAVSRMGSQSQPAESNGRMTIVTSASGGSGASVIAQNLAVMLAREHHRCGLLDYDLRKGDQAALFNASPRHTIADLCKNIEGLDHKMLEKSFVPHETGVHLLAAPNKLAEADVVDTQTLEKIARMASSLLPHVVVDLGDPSDRDAADLLRSAETILLVFRLEFPAVRNLNRLFEEWEHRGFSSQRVQLVANRHEPWMELPAAKVERALRRKIAHWVPNDSRLLNLSVNCGTPAVIESANCEFARSLHTIAGNIGGTNSATQPRTQKGKLRLREVLSRVADLKSLPLSIAAKAPA